MKITTLQDLIDKIESPGFEWPDEAIQISLKDEVLSRDDIIKLTSVLRDENCKLQRLELQNCFLDGQDVQAIIGALETRLPTLEVLDLSENTLGGEGAKSIAEALKKESMSNVRRITLTDTKMGDTEVEEIAKAIKVKNDNSSHSFVTVINVSGNYISLDAAERVVDVLGESYTLLDEPFEKRDLNFYIDIATDKDSQEKYQEREEKMYEKMRVSKDNFADSAVAPFYSSSRSPLTRMFTSKYEGPYTRTSQMHGTSLLAQFEQKIQYLEEKFKNDEKKQRFIGALRNIFAATKNDIDTQVNKIQLEDFDKEAPKLLESSAMIVLEATDQLLTKFLKEGENFDLMPSLRSYYGDCQIAKEWTIWQQLVASVIIGVVSFFSAINPGMAIPALSIIEKLDETSKDPKCGFYVVEQLFHSALGTGMKGAFFTPYAHLVSEVGKSVKDVTHDQLPSSDETKPQDSNPVQKM